MNSNDHSVLREKILDLKKQKNAIILAHYYQQPEIQDIADYVGDSLGLSQQATVTDSDIIVFAGVKFMAETAKILNPAKKVLLPDMAAGCSLADNCVAEDFRAFKARYPDHVVVTYVNCSAAVKALSDIICTSANAVNVVNSIPIDTPVIFAPDKNLGKYVQSRTGRKLVLWDGACIVHEAFSMAKINALRLKYPDARLVAHPESDEMLLAEADFVGSTTALIKFVSKSDFAQFIVATEAGILHKMRIAAPGKLLIPAPSMAANACACNECPYMKLNTLEKLYQCLENEHNEILVDESIRLKAIAPLHRMLALSESPVSS